MTLHRFATVILSLAVLLALTGCAQESAGDTKTWRPGAHAENQHQQPQTAHRDNHSTAEEHRDARQVRLSGEQAALLTIEVDAAPEGTAGDRITAPATVAFDPDRTARVGPRLAARVVKVLVDLGDQVQAGQPLALMDSVALGRAKADYLSAQGRLQSARADWQRERSLAEEQISSEAEQLDARTAFQAARAAFRAAHETLKLFGLEQDEINRIGEQTAALSRFTLSAPTGGEIQRRDLAPGQSLSARDTPIHIVDSQTMWLMIDAFEEDLPRLRPGQRVSFVTRGLPGRTFSGRTNWISRELDPESRTLTVRALLENPAGMLRAGMAGTASIQTHNQADHALVPIDAVQRLGQQDVVFVPGSEARRYQAVPVKLGQEDSGWVEVHNGLQPGDQVVVRGAFDLMSALTAASRSAAHSH